MLIVDGILGDAWNQIVILSLCLRARHIKSDIKMYTNTFIQSNTSTSTCGMKPRNTKRMKKKNNNNLKNYCSTLTHVIGASTDGCCWDNNDDDGNGGIHMMMLSAAVLLPFQLLYTFANFCVFLRLVLSRCVSLGHFTISDNHDAQSNQRQELFSDVLKSKNNKPPTD